MSDLIRREDALDPLTTYYATEYHRRNMQVARVCGAQASVDQALERALSIKSIPNWMIAYLESAAQRLPGLQHDLAAWRDLAPDSPETAITALPAVHLATRAELEALRKAAGIPHLPTQLTFEARLAIGGEGPRAYDWSDKPHRIVYNLCREIEKNAAERDRLREALLDHNDLLRSAIAIAEREGVRGEIASTNWDAYYNRAAVVLKRHHQITTDARAALKGESHD